jgi:hypothetical protein
MLTMAQEPSHDGNVPGLTFAKEGGLLWLPGGDREPLLFGRLNFASFS